MAEADLLEDGILQDRMKERNVVLCNPPFEAFTSKERSRYPIASEFYSKPVAVLNAALDAHPLALAFVLPRPFILDRQFAEQRRQSSEARRVGKEGFRTGRSGGAPSLLKKK